ncbi:MAG TPA: redoxin domain-containing protein [Verrucomicrobiota bacterium]|jgi:peroxiredoxin|nr:redoxin domain-containing protein [Verrucomicrobiota bacterium]
MNLGALNFRVLTKTTAIFVISSAKPVIAEDQTVDVQKNVLEGHSYHGEAFNEGPRQSAYLMKGMGRVRFQITTSVQKTQLFFAQGVAQLHGFWHFEAERSFRQAAMLDPDCAMTYWGMAVANRNNPERAKGFIEEAKKRKNKASNHEQLWIESEVNYWADTKKAKKDRRRKMVRDLEAIIYDYPEDIEAKAFLAVWIWQSSREGLPIHSHAAVTALIEDVLDVEPMHPCHHFRIHLWDNEKPGRALASAARCGQASPGIAHMWHMPGHIYSKLKRYHDSAWQQEASARVDHAHMMRDRVMPDQIHNFAHNNEWLTRNLNHLGRVNDAVALARNMIEMPRHPKYNSLAKPNAPTEYGKRGSARYGRTRLIETLLRYEMWEEIISASQTVYLEPTAIPEEQAKRLAAVGIAHYALGEAEKGAKALNSLDELKEYSIELKLESGAKAEEAARAGNNNDKEVETVKANAIKPFDNRIKTINQYRFELLAYQSAANENADEFNKQIAKASKMSRERKSQLQLQVGNNKEAIRLASQSDSAESQVQPLANYTDILWRSGKEKEAVEQFKKLRNISAHIDLERAVFKRLAPVARKLELPEDWRIEHQPADDVGNRPSLDKLGPFRWSPSPAGDWTLTDGQGKKHTLTDYTGRPVIVIFYLGKGCAHCIEQLGTFAPETDRFKQAGIDLIAISTDDVDGLRQTFQQNKTGSPFPFPLVSDSSLKVFKEYRAYDDFEQQPLHGTFLIDRQGLVRWQDISYEPFTEVEFLLDESKRLLSQDPPQVTQN